MKTSELARGLGISWETCKAGIKRGMPTDSVESAIIWRSMEHERRSLAARKWILQHPEESAERNKQNGARIRGWIKDHPEEAKEALDRSYVTLSLWAKNNPEKNKEKTILAMISAEEWRHNHPNELIASGKRLSKIGARWAAEHPDERKKKWVKTLEKSHIARIGTHGFGKCEIGRLDHARAKSWTVQSPDGKRYSFQNLEEWCRSNEHLFYDDECAYKKPLYARAANGMRGKPSWRGWITIECGDIV